MANTKMNKEQMVKFLDEHFKEVSDNNLAERITYTANAWKKDAKQVTSLDLRDLVEEVKKFVAEVTAPAEPAVANSVKKTLKKTTPKAEKADEQEEASEETPAQEEPAKKVSKKTTPKKTEGAVKATGKAFDLADTFVDKFTTEIGEMTKAQDIKTFDDLRTALANGEEVYFAIYWSARLLKQFNYAGGVDSIKAPKKFDNDLDLVSCIYIGDEDTVAVGVSASTDAVYVFQPKDLNMVEDENFRLVNHMEYEIYRLTPAD